MRPGFPLLYGVSWLQWLTPVIPALGGRVEKDAEFKASLDDCRDLIPQTKTKQKNSGRINCRVGRFRKTQGRCPGGKLLLPAALN